MSGSGVSPYRTMETVDGALKQGDIVRHKAGGPLMTVRFVDGPVGDRKYSLYNCSFFWNGNYHDVRLTIQELVRAELPNTVVSPSDDPDRPYKCPTCRKFILPHEAGEHQSEATHSQTPND